MEMTTCDDQAVDSSTSLSIPEPKTTELEGCCFERSFSALTVDDVYDIAKLIGAEVERLVDGYGSESAAGLVPKIVKVLELLESFASRNHAHRLREEELLRTFETLQLQQQKKQRAGEEANDKKHEIIRQQEAQQKEEQLKGRCEDLQAQVQQLRDERQELQSRLRGNHAQDDRVQRQEREVMLKLKEVVDKQRDELRAKVQEISTVSKEVEALQEQLERFMKMNGELRHRQHVLQAQLTSAAEKKADMEADLRQKEKEIERLKTKRSNSTSSPLQSSVEQTAGNPDLPCFTKKEVRDILHERNELKTNLFLVQEELNYYQREILNDEKCPGFLLDAIRSTIRKQRTVIKAKMLGIPVDECSSDEEEKGPLFEQTEVDSTDGRPAESRIRNLFGFLTRSGNARSPTHTHMSASASAWEIIGDAEVNGDELI